MYKRKSDLVCGTPTQGLIFAFFENGFHRTGGDALHQAGA
jgi:hypothetical protein